MQYLSIFLVLLACNAQQNTASRTPASGQAQAVSTASPLNMDSLVAPQYDQAGKLIRIEKSQEQWKKQLTQEEY